MEEVQPEAKWAQLASRVDSIDKVSRLLVWIVGAIVAVAIWCTSINYRLSTVELDRAQRIPQTDQWKAQVDQANQKRDDSIVAMDRILSDLTIRVTDMERAERLKK